MKEDEIKKGSVVRLKAGGPFMTVSDVSNTVKVIWFDAGQNLRANEFDASVLHVVK